MGWDGTGQYLYKLRQILFHRLQYIIDQYIANTMRCALLLAILVMIAHSEVVDYSESAMARVYQFHLDALIIFNSDGRLQSSAYQALRQYAEKSSQLTIILLVKSQNEKAYAKLSKYYGIDDSLSPQIIYLSNQKKKYRFQQNNITADGIASFISAVKNGSVSPYYKSEPIPLSNHQSIKQVVGKSFSEIVINTSKQVLVYFYGPKCARCIHFAPHLEQLANSLVNNPNIVVARFDATANEVEGLSIQSFPTLKFWRKDKSSPLTYTGKHTYQHLLEWLKKYTQYPWIQSNQSIDQTL